MVTVDFDLHLHNAIRLLMREEGKSADQAFDEALPLIFTVLAQDGADPLELDLHRTALLYRRESILTPYRTPRPDLSDLTFLQQRNDKAVKRQRERHKRRQLGGRP